LKPELTTIAEAILERNYKSNEPVKPLVPLKGGEWSAAYKFSAGGRSYVIRFTTVEVLDDVIKLDGSYADRIYQKLIWHMNYINCELDKKKERKDKKYRLSI